MSNTIQGSTLEKFTTFGDLLRFLRRRGAITQLELSTAVGYSDAQISRLEQNLRLPDLPTIEARFVPALGLENEPKAVARLLDLAANVRREDAPSFGVSPYKGLSYFDEADADLFAGRETLTTQLTERVLALASNRAQNERRFLAIVGASGSGKSSLVRAGVVPALRWNKFSTDWSIHTITPTAHPLESLAASLTNTVAATTSLMDDLARDTRTLNLFIKRSIESRGASRFLLVVDQFEEVFTLCHSEEIRASFINNLLTASTEAGNPVITIIAMRADFYAHCAAYPQLREALAQQQEYIGAMTDLELRRAIEEPARRGRWEFETGLVDLLLHDVGHEPGALPLLSHALLETWQRRRGHTMTLSGYTSSGGVRGAIAETAESVFTDQFTREQQLIARRIFLRLTEMGDEPAAGDTRRRATFKELILKPEESGATQSVLMSLANARLLTTTEDAAEVAHEALIREWPRLRGWLEDNREDLRLHRQFTEGAQQWAALNREQDALYRGARLTQVREWAAGNVDEMNALEREFLTASIEDVEREATEREKRRQHELEAVQNLARAEKVRAEEQTKSANRLRVRNRIISAVGTLGLILAIMAGLFGAQSRNNFTRAESLRLAAEANVLLARGGDVQIATLLSIRALQSYYSPQADAVLSASLARLYNRQIFIGHSGSIYSVSFSPDGKYALTGSQDGTARLWDVRNGQQVRQFAGHRGGVSAVAFSPDGKFILTGGNDQTVRLWEAGTGQQLRLFSGHTDGITSVAFSSDGQYILSASGDKTARLWDTQTGQEIRSFNGHTELVSDAEVSPDGHFIITGSYDNTTRLWDTATGNAIRTFASGGAGFTDYHVTSVAFSPDGKYVLTGSSDRTAKLWDTESGQQICTFAGHTDSVNDVAFSPDGKYVLTGSEDKTARVWEAQTCQAVDKFEDNGSGVKSVAYSPDGQSILTGGEDHIGHLWAAPASAPLRTFTHSTGEFKSFTYSPGGQYVATVGGVNSVAFSPDGRFVLTGGDDHVARLWEASTGKELRDFIGHTNSISGVAFSPDGKYILTSSSDQTTRLWNAETGQQVQTVLANTGGVVSVAFSPDGKYFLTTGAEVFTPGLDNMGGETKLWEVATGRQVRVYNYGPDSSNTNRSSILAFSPDGNKAAVMMYTVEVVLFNIGTGKQICNLNHATYITSLAFSPDGSYVLSGSSDGTARLWDVKTCKQLRVFTDQTSIITSVAFSPDGKYVLTAHDDNKARLWDTATGQQLREFSGHTSWLNTAKFSQDGRYVLTGSQDGTARLWDTDYHNTIRFACSLLWRDLTSVERTQFSISDNAATCQKP